MKNFDKEYEKIIKKISKNKNIFSPNLTTKLSAQAALTCIKKKKNILDLGCGNGVIGIIIKKFLPHVDIFCSDLQIEATNEAKKNFKKFKIKSKIVHGDLFRPWESHDIKFDYIINDVSAISNQIAQKSPWFNGDIPCDTGIDGTKQVIKIIKESPNFLKNNGCIQIPLLSLSNTNRIINQATLKFKKVDIILKQDWFLPEEMMKHLDMLNKLKLKKIIDYKLSFGKIICNTAILLCRDKK